MAKVSVDLPRPAKVTVVDSAELAGPDVGEINEDTGLPKQIQAFLVVKDPPMTVVPNFFTDVECDHLLDLVEGCWNPSMVGQATYSTEEQYSKGDLENMLSETRTSWSCMIRYAQTSIVERLEYRLACLANMPLDHLERMNLVRYAPGELFNEHHDGKFRPITIFVYLNDLPQDDVAGDTFFPFLGLSFRPRRGTAVMWSNCLQDGREDSRMLHAGRAPQYSIKYGVNCFFNCKSMRAITPTSADAPYESAALVDAANLGSDRAQSTKPELIAYRLSVDPSIVAVPHLLIQEEVEELLAEVADRRRAVSSDRRPGAHLLEQATKTLEILTPPSTPLVEALEERVAKAGGIGADHLAPLRLVQPGQRVGLCNRGCGPKSLYVCLTQSEEIYFPRLRIRVVLHSGDALMWSNVDWSTGTPADDLRTLRYHAPYPREHDDAVLVGVDGFFHDNPVREQRKLRQFVFDDEVGSIPGSPGLSP